MRAERPTGNNTSYDSEPSSSNSTSSLETTANLDKSDDICVDAKLVDILNVNIHKERPIANLDSTWTDDMKHRHKGYPITIIDSFKIEKTSQQEIRCQIPFTEMGSECIDMIKKGSHSEPNKQTEVFNILNGDNSSNAVYNSISNATLSVPIELKELTFNGKIKKDTPPPSEGQPNGGGGGSIFQKLISSREKSPDLFADDDDDDGSSSDEYDCNSYDKEDATQSNGVVVEIASAAKENSCQTIDKDLQELHEIEQTRLRRMQSALSGILPPPSIRNVSFNIAEMLSLYKQNFNKDTSLDVDVKNEGENIACDNKFLSKPKKTVDEVKEMEWPEVGMAKAHGLSYNLSVNTEQIEALALKYLDKFVGAETSSSFIEKLQSSPKMRREQMKLVTKSPGSRLSHLAIRRVAFSSLNMSLCNSQGGRPIYVNTGKLLSRHKSASSTSTTSLSSASTSQLGLASLEAKPAATRETSRRALFQSPPKEIPKPQLKPGLALRADKSRRVLFSPDKFPLLNSCNQSYVNGSLRDKATPFGQFAEKRKRNEENEFGTEHATKLRRLDQFENNKLTPNSQKFYRSQSCFGPLKPSVTADISSTGGRSLFRASSDQSGIVQTLSEAHKLKLLWAVAETLKTKKISSKHEHYKQFARVMAQVVKRLYVEFRDRYVGRTSEVMLRICNKIAFLVLQERNADEIYVLEKSNLEINKNRPGKLTGYIGAEAYEQRLKQMQATQPVGNTSFSENSLHSFNLHGESSQQQKSAQKDVCGPDTSSVPVVLALTSSTSKNNSENIVLRENVDMEQRLKSAQKNLCFSGKDQKNVSPFNDRQTRSSMKKQASLVCGSGSGNQINKVKRQISFE